MQSDLGQHEGRHLGTEVVLTSGASDVKTASASGAGSRS